MKLKLKKKRVLPSPSRLVKSTPWPGDLKSKSVTTNSRMPSSRKSTPEKPNRKSSVRDEALDRIKHEFGRFQAAIDDLRRWGTDRGVDQASDILAATYRLLDLCELHNPEPRKGKAR